MTVDDYIRLFQPAMKEAAELLVSFESKYGDGIVFSEFDAICATGHMISSMKGVENEDGKTHAVAALSRAIKVVLKELDND